MMRPVANALRRFRREENGQMLIEFALLIPLIFTIFMTSVELGMYQMRQMFLDRGLDMAVRQVRLNTSARFDHTTVKDMICEFSGFLDDCDTQLRLEMIPADLRSFVHLDGDADCNDTSQPVTPLRNFVHGGEHQMMLMRACYKFEPVFPTSGLGLDFARDADGTGRAIMVSMTAFVQEPS